MERPAEPADGSAYLAAGEVGTDPQVWYLPLEHYDEAAVAKHFKPGADAALAAARERLAALPAWTVEMVVQALHDAAAALELGMGKIAQPLRVAITGTQVSPDIPIPCTWPVAMRP